MRGSTGQVVGCPIHMATLLPVCLPACLPVTMEDMQHYCTARQADGRAKRRLCLLKP